MNNMHDILSKFVEISTGHKKTKTTLCEDKSILSKGNAIEVTDDDTGEITSYDKATYDEINGMNEDEDDDLELDLHLDDIDDDLELDLHLDDIDDLDSDYDNGEFGGDYADEFSSEADVNIDYEDDRIEHDLNFEDSNRAGAYLDEDSDATPEYSKFELKIHGRRLRPGTPITFSNDIGGGEGIFIEKSPSGAFGTAMRNNKTISIHLNDIESADLQHSSIYEGFEKSFDELMEGITITKTDNPSSPELNTITITGTDTDADALDEIVRLAGTPQDAVVPDIVPPADNENHWEQPDVVLDEAPDWSPSDELNDDDDYGFDEVDVDPGYEEEKDFPNYEDTVDDIDLDEDFMNTPDEIVADIDVVTHSDDVTGDDMHKHKKSYSDKAFRGDNPMNETHTTDKSDNSFLDFYKVFKQH